MLTCPPSSNLTVQQRLQGGTIMTRTTKIALALSLFAATVFTVGLTNSAAAEKPTPSRSTARSDEVRVF